MTRKNRHEIEVVFTPNAFKEHTIGYMMKELFRLFPAIEDVRMDQEKGVLILEMLGDDEEVLMQMMDDAAEDITFVERFRLYSVSFSFSLTNDDLSDLVDLATEIDEDIADDALVLTGSDHRLYIYMGYDVQMGAHVVECVEDDIDGEEIHLLDDDALLDLFIGNPLVVMLLMAFDMSLSNDEDSDDLI